MSNCPHRIAMRYKRWATQGLNDVIAENLGRIVEPDRILVLRLLDHIHVVDEIFCHNLEAGFHGHLAPRSIELPSFEAIDRKARAIAAWYVDYAEDLTPERRDAIVEFDYSNGAPARMTRGEMLMHVAMHGTYHRGQIGILLQKNWVAPNSDRMTDFLESERNAPDSALPALVGAR